MPGTTKPAPTLGGIRGHAPSTVIAPSVAPKSSKLGAFADVYRRQCSSTKSYPLSCLLTPNFFATGTLRVPCDKVVADSDWDLLIGSLVSANDLRGLCLWSTWWHERKAQLLRLRSTTDVNKARDSIKNKIPLVLHMEITEPLMKSISTAMRHCKQLSSLTLAGIILHPSCVRILAAAVAKSHSLSHLSLSRCEMGDQGFREIASAIKSSSSLTVLDLSDNLLTHTSAALLADALKSQSVRRMESAFPHLLRTTSKKSIDSAYASSSLSSPSRPFLKRVNLCCNPLSDTGLYYLLDALQSDVGVAAIDLQFTKLTNAGLEAAWLVLQDVPDAVALDVRNNPDADTEWIAKVMALAGSDNSAHRDPELAWIPDGVHPLEASLAQGANAPPRVPKVKQQQAAATSRYAVPHAGRSPVKTHAGGGVGVQVPRPAWRPAGISQLPVAGAGGADVKRAGGKKAQGGMSPHGWHPVVDVVQLEDLVVKNQALADKVSALEHVVLKHALEEPSAAAARSRASTVGGGAGGYEEGMDQLGVPNLYEAQHPEQYYPHPHAPTTAGLEGMYVPNSYDVRYPAHPHTNPAHLDAALMNERGAHGPAIAGLPNVYEQRLPERYMHMPANPADMDWPFMEEHDHAHGHIAGLPNLYEMRHPEAYMHAPAADLGAPFTDQPDDHHAQHHRWMVGPDGQVVDAHGRTFYQSPGVGRPMTTTAIVQTGPAAAHPYQPAPPMTPVHQRAAPLAPRPTVAPASTSPPRATSPPTPTPSSPSSYATVVATLKSLHAQLKHATSAWDVHHARRKVVRARWSVVAHSTARTHARPPLGVPPPVITESLNKLDAMATALDRRWWDKHPDLMRRVADVDRWVGEVAGRCKAGEVDDPRVVETEASERERTEVEGKAQGAEQVGRGAREQSPPLRLQDLQGGTGSEESGGEEREQVGKMRVGGGKARERTRTRTRTASGRPPLPMVELETENAFEDAIEENGA